MRGVLRGMMLGISMLGTACVDWKQPTEVDRPTITRYIALVRTADGVATAVRREGDPPTAGGAPVVTANIPNIVLLGGTSEVLVTAPSAFSKIIVAVPEVDDYWELTLPAAATSQSILLVFGTDIPLNSFGVKVGGGLGGGFGAYQERNVSVLNVGTGEVQVNVTWDSKADVDLYLVEPGGAELFYGARTSPNGGELDLDSNAACGSDGPRAENTFYRRGIKPPRGEYGVRVNYWAACGAAATRYVVTVNVKGQLPQIFSGVFTGPGVGGAAGAGKNITNIIY